MNKSIDIHKYCGAIHIHTVNSDGTGSVSDIAKAANRCGLSWIIITDHNNLDIEEGYIDGVLVIKGEEISSEYGNHYLAFGIDNFIEPSDNCEKNIIKVRENGGFGFAAHPDESVNRKNKYKPLRWTDKNNIPDGVEIWNWFSQWADNYNSNNIFSVIYSYIFKNNLVKRPASDTIKWWDCLNNSSDKIIPAIGGTDAHAMRVRYIIPVTIFPYKFMLNTIVNEIYLDCPLSSDFNIAKEQILSALKSGNNVIANKSVCKKIPEIYVLNSDSFAGCGGSISKDENTFLYVENSVISNIKILKDGIEIHNCKAKSCKLKISQTGKYRVQVEMNKRGFAYSNPIIVK